jgi:hypothetical protein
MSFVTLYNILDKFKEEADKLGWQISRGKAWNERVIKGANEVVFFTIRDYSNRVPTHIVERDLDLLSSEISKVKEVKAYGAIFLSPSTTSPAEKLIADRSDKAILIELDQNYKIGRKLDKAGSKVIYFFVKWLSETYGVKFEEITWPFKDKEGIQTFTQSFTKPFGSVEEADVVGEPINFRGMVYAPLNEAGMILLFARVMDDLGIIYESSPPDFPDMIGRRKAGDKWQRVRIEFEYKSSNFKQHGHQLSKCDIIVCWEHDWPDCPIEVIELRDVIRRLRPY